MLTRVNASREDSIPIRHLYENRRLNTKLRSGLIKPGRAREGQYELTAAKTSCACVPSATAEPRYRSAGGLTCAWLKRVSISPSTHSNASDDKCISSVTRLEQSVDLSRMLNSSVALNCACLLMWSSPWTMTNFLDSSRTPKRKTDSC